MTPSSQLVDDLIELNAASRDSPAYLQRRTKQGAKDVRRDALHVQAVLCTSTERFSSGHR